MEMGRQTAVLFFVTAGIFCPHVACGMNHIAADIFGTNLTVTDDIHVARGVNIAADKISIDESVRVFNEANIRGDVHVCNGCDFIIRNSGNCIGHVHLGLGATMTQIVHGAADLTYMDVDGPYVVLADGVQGVLWDELATLGENAGTLIVRDSRVVMSDHVAQIAARLRQSAHIILRGTVTLALSQGYDIGDGPVIENVAGDASIVIDGPPPDPLHAFMANVQGGGLYISLVRETDYYKIFGDTRGRMLNMVRDVRPDDALLGRLDAADSMEELWHIMSHSIAFNPSLMLRPMRVMDSFMTNSADADMRLDVPLGTMARSFYISAGDASVVGAVTDAYLRLGGGLAAGASVYAGAGENDDDINAFSVTMFGGRAFANYSRGYVNLRVLAGATYADFEVPYIFDDGNIHNSAKGRSEYGVMDIGVKIGVVTPYVGVGARREHILSQTKNYIATRTGFNAAYHMRVSDIAYEYKMGAGADSLGRLHAGVGINFLSPDDGMGGGISVDSMRDSQSWSYMVSLAMRIHF